MALFLHRKKKIETGESNDGKLRREEGKHLHILAFFFIEEIRYYDV
jgi:hypothetical protein